VKAFLQRVLVLGAALFPARLVLFLGLFAWHLQVTVDSRCVFFAQNDLFLWNYRFFRDFLLTAGGLAGWLGELVLQACHFGWPGALALTAVVWLVLIATKGFMKTVSPSGTGAMWTAPAIVLVAVHSRYDYPFSITIGAALAMAAALGYVRAADRWGGWRVLWFAALCALVYYAAGAAFYVFAFCTLIYEFYRPGSRWAKLGLIAGATAARFAVERVLDSFEPGSFYLHIPAAAAFAEERSLNAVVVAVYASFPLGALLLADRAAQRRRKKSGDPPPSTVADAPRELTKSGGRLRWMAGTVLLIVAAIVAGRIAARPNIRTVLTLHECADGERWDEVLRLGTRVPADLYSAYVVHDVNLALYHTDRMTTDMFSYRQFGSPFVLEWKPGPCTLSMLDLDALTMRKLGDLHLRLGRMNDAEYYAHESYVRHPSAKCLRLLAKTAMAKHEVEQARLFLSVLRDDLVYGSWAADWLTRLQRAPSLTGDTEIDRIRSLRLAEEDIYQTATFIPNTIIAGRDVSTPDQIASLLRQNPQNRMAFEYLMAVYLVNTDVAAAAALLPKAADFSYPGTPPVYEEAAMVSARANRSKLDTADGKVAVNGCVISEQILDRIHRFDEAKASGHLDREEISRLAGELGLAYFQFYYGRRGD